MIKMEKFLISKGPYAVDLASFNATWNETRWQGEPPPGAAKGSWHCTIRAVWFRRRRGETVASIGTLWKSFREAPVTALEFLEQHVDGRYGGDAVGRWDGDGYWGNVSLETQQEHLKILRPMLANYPAVPAGFDGWWKF
ncbi:hypothetical protein [Lentzea cavernae]|uniref:Uncharacterized protein n=1 Tax=Lentzea cavernae TaxID=2020703 RepID=A0ABQ3MTU2_9PSEU|nr:hypothetical protein [Lentzea cavernae]GHH57556.1 hypothetical protein GCM10017774_77250 [Lentzea cavernae]